MLAACTTRRRSRSRAAAAAAGEDAAAGRAGDRAAAGQARRRSRRRSRRRRRCSRRSRFDALPGWQQDDLRQAWPAFQASCRVLAPSPTGRRRAPPAAAGRRRATPTRSAASSKRISCRNLVRAPDGADTGLITGYYEPLLHGARKRGGAYQTPLVQSAGRPAHGRPGQRLPEPEGHAPARPAGRQDRRAVRHAAPRSSAPACPARNWSGSTIRSRRSSWKCRARAGCSSTTRRDRARRLRRPERPSVQVDRPLAGRAGRTDAGPGLGAGHQGLDRRASGAPPGTAQRQSRAMCSSRKSACPIPRVGPKGALGVPLTPERSVAIDPTFLPLGAPLFLSTTAAGQRRAAAAPGDGAGHRRRDQGRRARRLLLRLRRRGGRQRRAHEAARPAVGAAAAAGDRAGVDAELLPLHVAQAGAEQVPSVSSSGARRHHGQAAAHAELLRQQRRRRPRRAAPWPPS